MALAAIGPKSAAEVIALLDSISSKKLEWLNLGTLLDSLAASADVATYAEATFVATFDQAVGAKTVVVRKIGKTVHLEIPTGTTADGGGAAIASGATDVTAAYRPAADLSFSVIVTNNAAKVTGKMVITSAGRINFYKDAASGVFTDDAAAGFDRIAVSYTLA